jgi:urease accessory protein
MIMKKTLMYSLFGAALLPVAASAHTGVGMTAGFGAGFTHPLLGLDHLLAMLAVGLWAAQQGGRALWSVPAAFVIMMIGGGALAVAGIAMPFVESGIVLSVLVLGLLIAAAIKFPLWAGSALVAVFAVFHGHAHGAEMPLQAGAALYTAGFALVTALLHGLGIAAGLALRHWNVANLARVAGGIIALSGVYLAFA